MIADAAIIKHDTAMITDSFVTQRLFSWAVLSIDLRQVKIIFHVCFWLCVWQMFIFQSFLWLPVWRCLQWIPDDLFRFLCSSLVIFADKSHRIRSQYEYKDKEAVLQDSAKLVVFLRSHTPGGHFRGFIR